MCSRACLLFDSVLPSCQHATLTSACIAPSAYAMYASNVACFVAKEQRKLHSKIVVFYTYRKSVFFLSDPHAHLSTPAPFALSRPSPITPAFFFFFNFAVVQELGEGPCKEGEADKEGEKGPQQAQGRHVGLHAILSERAIQGGLLKRNQCGVSCVHVCTEGYSLKYEKLYHFVIVVVSRLEPPTRHFCVGV